MIFSKDKFNENATRATKKLLAKHIDILDKMEVAFNEEFGEIEEYIVDGEGFYLYPVYKNWCEE